MSRVFLVFLVACSSMLGCEKRGQSEPVSVVASIHPLYLLARDIGGPGLPLELLLQGQADPHAHNLRVSELKSLKGASLVLMVDRDFEHFLEKGLGAEQAVVVFRESITPDSMEANNHLWLHPAYALQLARVYADRFTKLFPDRRDDFLARLAVFEDSVDQKRAEYSNVFQSLKKANFVVDHDAYAAFINAFALSRPKVLRATDEETLSAKAWVEAKAYAETARCLVVDHMSGQAEKMAATLDLPLVAIDPLGFQPKAGSYLALIDQVAAGFVRCLHGQKSVI